MIMLKLLPIPTHACCRMRDSNDMSDRLQASKVFDLEAAGRRGRGRIDVHVDGYWSDVIQVTIEREFFGSDKWSVSVSHSSGGRLTKQDDKHYPAPFYKALECDLDAEECFGMALQAAVAIGRQLLASEAWLEGYYQEAVKERRKADAVAKAELEKAVLGDPALGEAGAKALVEKASELARTYRGREIYIKAIHRGSDGTRPDSFMLLCGQNISFRWHGGVVSKKLVIEKLAAFSVRSHVIELK